MTWLHLRWSDKGQYDRWFIWTLFHIQQIWIYHNSSRSVSLKMLIGLLEMYTFDLFLWPVADLGGGDSVVRNLPFLDNKCIWMISFGWNPLYPTFGTHLLKMAGLAPSWQWRNIPFYYNNKIFFTFYPIKTFYGRII